jgi:hypothetical protein
VADSRRAIPGHDVLSRRTFAPSSDIWVSLSFIHTKSVPAAAESRLWRLVNQGPSC